MYGPSMKRPRKDVEMPGVGRGNNPDSHKKGLSVGDVFKLKGPRLEKLLRPGSPQRDFIVKTIVSHWQQDEVAPPHVKEAMKQLLPHTVKGGHLADLHPGDTVLHRGGIIATRAPQAYSRSEKGAMFFKSPGQKKPTSIKVNGKTAAIDFDKVLGKGKSEKEVVVLRDASARR